jgi:hypothetical protein
MVLCLLNMALQTIGMLWLLAECVRLAHLRALAGLPVRAASGLSSAWRSWRKGRSSRNSLGSGDAAASEAAAAAAIAATWKQEEEQKEARVVDEPTQAPPDQPVDGGWP